MATKKKEQKTVTKKKAGAERPASSTMSSTSIVAQTVKPGIVQVTVQKKQYGQAPQEFKFYLRDGRELQSVYDLIDSLDTMSDDVFFHHVNPERNDFANWLEGVFEEKTLAEEMRQIRGKLDTQVKLLKHVIQKLR